MIDTEEKIIEEEIAETDEEVAVQDQDSADDVASEPVESVVSPVKTTDENER